MNDETEHSAIELSYTQGKMAERARLVALAEFLQLAGQLSAFPAAARSDLTMDQARRQFGPGASAATGASTTGVATQNFDVLAREMWKQQQQQPDTTPASAVGSTVRLPPRLVA